jgi:Lar family restriction alleviation protein
MQYEPKPCPFCGEEPHVFCTGNAFPRKYFRVLCKRNCCMQSKLYTNKAEAVRMWNRRAKDNG